MNNTKNGFTYIEMILYIAIVTIFVGGSILFAWDAIYIQIRSREEQSVSNNLRLVSKRLSYEIRNSVGINSITNNSLSLNVSDSTRNPTVFSLNNGHVYLGFGFGGACPVNNPCMLTDDNVTVTNLYFQDLTTSDNISLVKYSVSIRGNNQKIQVQKSDTFTSSVEIRGNDGT